MSRLQSSLQRVQEMETSHGFEKMRLTVVTELRRMFSNANSEMQSLSERGREEKEGRRLSTEGWQSRCITKKN